MSIVMLLTLAGCQDADQGADGDDGTGPAQELSVGDEPFALYDLFTSEGCSSCPAAEDLLAEVLDEARDDDTRFFAMAWHVDYWDYLGWTDLYGDEAYAQRQYDYSEQWNTSQIYTPQGVMNGWDAGFVGSNSSDLNQAMDDALDTDPQTVVSLGLLQDEPNSDVLVVDTAVNDAPDDSVLHLAVVQRGIEVEPSAGENRGRTLNHENVVRAWVQVDVDEGRVEIDLPEDLDRSEASVVAWVQDDQLEVVGAHSVDLE